MYFSEDTLQRKMVVTRGRDHHLGKCGEEWGRMPVTEMSGHTRWLVDWSANMFTFKGQQLHLWNGC